MSKNDISKEIPELLADDDEPEFATFDPFLTVIVAEALVFGAIMIGIAATVQDWPRFLATGGVGQ